MPKVGLISATRPLAELTCEELANRIVRRAPLHDPRMGNGHSVCGIMRIHRFRLPDVGTVGLGKYTTVRPIAHAKKQYADIRAARCANIYIKEDPDMLRQILTNIFANTRVFTDQGNVREEELSP